MPEMKIRDIYTNLAQLNNRMVQAHGWCHAIRHQGENHTLFVLQDGSGALECVCENTKLSQGDNQAVSNVTVGCSMSVRGEMVQKQERVEAEGETSHVLSVDDWQLFCTAAPEEHQNITQQKSSALKVCSFVLEALRKHYKTEGYTEVTPPAIVPHKTTGSTAMFGVDYYNKQMYLTHTSHMYLESCLSALGDVYCINRVFRAEDTTSFRHLTEFTQVEVECAFVDFEELLERIERAVCSVCETVMGSECAALIKQLNPAFKIPQRPFRRVTYREAIADKKVQEICHKDGNTLTFSEDIPMSAERHLADSAGGPVLLIKFPAQQKPFYTKICKDDTEVTETVDVLLPGVGEAAGGSTRVWQHSELVSAMKSKAVDAQPFHWYMQQRQHGSVPHGGYGIGLERLLMWMLGSEHIRDVCLYPRDANVSTP